MVEVKETIILGEMVEVPEMVESGGTGTSEVGSVCTFEGTVINEPYKIIG